MKNFIHCIALAIFAHPVLAADVSDSMTSHVQSPPTTSTSASTTGMVAKYKADRIVVYSASWCAPCQRLKPILVSLQYQGYKVEYLDIDKDASKLKYEHRSVPTIYYLRGDAVIKKETGYRSQEQIMRLLGPDRERVGFQADPASEPSDTAMNLRSGVRRS